MASIASAYVTISPQYDKGFGKDLTSKIKGETSRAGDESGSSFMSRFKGGLMKAAGAVGLFAVGTKVAGSIMGGLNAGIARFDTINAFPKQMANLGISAGESEAAINKLSDKLKGLPTSLDAGAMGITRFVSKNSDIEKSTDMFLALNNAVIAGAAPLDIQNSALEQMTQAYSKGRMDMMEWRTLQMAMPGQLNQVASAMGMTADALGEGLRDGSVSMDDFMNKIVELNETGSGEFASFEEQARNSSGGIQTMMTNVGNAISRGWEKVLDAFGSERLAGIMQWVTDTIDGGFSNVLPIVEKLGELFDAGAEYVSRFADAFKSGFQESEVLDFIAEQFGNLQDSLQPFYENVLVPIGNFIIDVLAPALGAILGTALGILIGAVSATMDIFTELSLGIQALPEVFESVGTFITDTWEGVKSFFSDITSEIADKFNSFVTDAQDAWDEVSTAVGDAMSAASQWVDEKATAIETTLTDAWDSAKTWTTTKWGEIKFAISSKLSETLSDVASKLGSILGRITGAWENAKSSTREAFSTLVSTISGKLSEAVDWVRGLPGRIRSALGNVGNILVGAGRSIIDGFLKGLRQKYEDVKKFIGGIGSWIANNKGPKEYDLKLLRPAGRWIMSGLDSSLAENFQGVLSTVGSFAPAIESAFGDPSLDASSSYNATGAALNGGTTYNYYIDGVQISVGTPEEEAAFETLFGRKLNVARMGMGGAY